jgi:hypothetical protein
MTENGCLKAIAEWLETQVLYEYRLPSPRKSGDQPFHVFVGWLPEKKGKEDEDYPFCLVRPVDGTAGPDGTAMSVDIVLGVFAQEDRGCEYVLNVQRRLLNALGILGERRLADKYALSMPVTWELPDDQPYPVWVAVVHTEWTYHSPIMPFFDDADWGRPASVDVEMRQNSATGSFHDGE